MLGPSDGGLGGQDAPDGFPASGRNAYPSGANAFFADVPEDESLQTEMAQGGHDWLVAGHFGQEKTIEIVTRDFKRKGLADSMRDYVRSCDKWQQTKSPRHAKYGLHQPLEVPYAAWGSIGTGFITQLPESQGKTQIMVVVDQFTKMGHFIGLHERAIAKDVADTFLRQVWIFRDCQTGFHRTCGRSCPANFRNHCARC